MYAKLKNTCLVRILQIKCAVRRDIKHTRFVFVWYAFKTYLLIHSLFRKNITNAINKHKHIKYAFDIHLTLQYENGSYVLDEVGLCMLYADRSVPVFHYLFKYD